MYDKMSGRIYTKSLMSLAIGDLLLSLRGFISFIYLFLYNQILFINNSVFNKILIELVFISFNSL